MQDVVLRGRVIGEAALQQLAHQLHLGVSEQHTELGTRERAPMLFEPVHQYLPRRQVLGKTVQSAPLLQCRHEVAEVVRPRVRPKLVQ